MISKIRRYVGQNKIVRRVFNKLGGVDYAIYDRTNIIVGSKFIDYFVTVDGAKYKVDGHSNFMVEETRLEYDWSDIRPNDVVLDIGANIGGFTIGAALKSKHVYAVEPLFYKELEVNIKLNNLSNVTILPFAIGDGGIVDISFNKVEQKNVLTYTLINLINMIRLQSNGQHNISFIKCDCEGGEWYIKSSDLDGVRRIEMEIHPNNFPTEAYNRELIPYIKQKWDTKFTEEERETYMLHSYKRGE